MPLLPLRIVPFRDSQITRLFRDSLMGWGRTVMIANASSSAADFDETLHALKYAAIAKEITIQSKINSWRPTSFTHTQTGAKKRLGSKLTGEIPGELPVVQ
jgi:hypothetical protein